MLKLKSTLISSEIVLMHDDNYSGATAELFNFQGNSVKKIRALDRNGSTAINIDDLQNGVYSIKVVARDGAVKILRFVKKE